MEEGKNRWTHLCEAGAALELVDISQDEGADDDGYAVNRAAKGRQDGREQVVQQALGGIACRASFLGGFCVDCQANCLQAGDLIVYLLPALQQLCR